MQFIVNTLVAMQSEVDSTNEFHAAEVAEHEGKPYWSRFVTHQGVSATSVL